MGGILVRDKVPAKIEEGFGIGTEVEVLVNPDKFSAALRTKLVKEAREAASSENEIKLIEELVDLAEVVLALCRLYGISPEAVEIARKKKFDSCGGFENRLFLIIN